jgi:hypothetical protein
MASYSVQTGAHKTLGAATVDDVTLNSYGAVIQIAHRLASSTTPLYVTFGATVASTATPTVGGDNTFVVPVGQIVSFPWPLVGIGTTCAIKLICTAADPYSIQVIAARAF